MCLLDLEGLGVFQWRKNGEATKGRASEVLGEGACENPVGLSMCDGPIETVKYIWVNIWCMLDWILSQKCRNTLPLHKVDQLARSAKT